MARPVPRTRFASVLRGCYSPLSGKIGVIVPCEHLPVLLCPYQAGVLTHIRARYIPRIDQYCINFRLLITVYNTGTGGAIEPS